MYSSSKVYANWSDHLGAVLQVQGRAGGRVNTVAGYSKLVERLDAISADAQNVKTATKRSRQQLDQLMNIAAVRSCKCTLWQVTCTLTE